ncbi:MAG: hypothetical protein J5I98_15980 [Phaeodactylibacter sp.]|nr:hypothetical protein [Phaeodactylibacter sp.]
MQIATHKPNTAFFIFLLLGIFVLLFAVKRWEDVVKELPDGTFEYIELLVSDLTTVTSAETILMGAYPLLPENLKRPIARRLTVPPGSGKNLR